MKTVFQKIMDGEIPSEPVYRDDLCMAVRDINPQAPVHVILFPAKPVERLSKASPDDAGLLAHMLLAVPEIAGKLGIGDGFRVVINNGPAAGETVPHMHIHILGGRQMAWPPG